MKILQGYLAIMCALSIARAQASNKNVKRQLSYGNYNQQPAQPPPQPQQYPASPYDVLYDPGNTKQNGGIESNSIEQGNSAAQQLKASIAQQAADPKDLNLKQMYQFYYLAPQDSQKAVLPPPRNAFTHYYTASTPNQHHHHHYQAQFAHHYQNQQQLALAKPPALVYLQQPAADAALQQPAYHNYALNIRPPQFHTQQSPQSQTLAAALSPQSLANLANYGPHLFPADAQQQQQTLQPSQQPQAQQQVQQPLTYTLAKSVSPAGGYLIANVPQLPQQPAYSSSNLQSAQNYAQPLLYSGVPASSPPTYNHLQPPFRPSAFLGYANDQQQTPAALHNYHAHPTRPVQEPSPAQAESAAFKRNADEQQRLLYLAPTAATSSSSYDLYKSKKK